MPSNLAPIIANSLAKQQGSFAGGNKLLFLPTELYELSLTYLSANSAALLASTSKIHYLKLKNAAYEKLGLKYVDNSTVKEKITIDTEREKVGNPFIIGYILSELQKLQIKHAPIAVYRLYTRALEVKNINKLWLEKLNAPLVDQRIYSYCLCAPQHTMLVLQHFNQIFHAHKEVVTNFNIFNTSTLIKILNNKDNSFSYSEKKHVIKLGLSKLSQGRNLAALIRSNNWLSSKLLENHKKSKFWTWSNIRTIGVSLGVLLLGAVELVLFLINFVASPFPFLLCFFGSIIGVNLGLTALRYLITCPNRARALFRQTANEYRQQREQHPTANWLTLLAKPLLHMSKKLFFGLFTVPITLLSATVTLSLRCCKKIKDAFPFHLKRLKDLISLYKIVKQEKRHFSGKTKFNLSTPTLDHLEILSALARAPEEPAIIYSTPIFTKTSFCAPIISEAQINGLSLPNLKS